MDILMINGRAFEVMKSKKPVFPIGVVMGGLKAIYEAYGKPSVYKVAIWEDWYRWASNTERVLGFDITSHNTMQFTITGSYVDSNGDIWNLIITKAHNKAYKVTHFRW